MEGDDCTFQPDSSDDHSQRGSVASSATLSRGTVQQMMTKTQHGGQNSSVFPYVHYLWRSGVVSLGLIVFVLFVCSHSSRCAHIPVW